MAPRQRFRFAALGLLFMGLFLGSMVRSEAPFSHDPSRWPWPPGGWVPLGPPWTPGEALAPGPPWPAGGPTTGDATFWIGETGPTGPIFTGPHQYPFICSTDDPRNGLGQPRVDNHDGIGNAVFPEITGMPDYTAAPIGYSQYCSVPTRVDYLYFSTTANRLLPLPDPASVPDDVASIAVNGTTLNAVVRLERGTINRFIYSIAMLAPFAESLDSPAGLVNAAWNGKLVYRFEGGTAVGHYQGIVSNSAMLDFDALSRGYAVATSTGNKTNTHYNLRLAEETAMMVKQHFIATYGEPDYTIGVGASGGAVQQYVIAQNNPSILDAAITQYAYPDMITQTISIPDCELLERYFDMEYTADPASLWADWLVRARIEGLATNATADAPPWNENPDAPAPGSSECINGWRGAVPEMVNASWIDESYLERLRLYRYPEAVIAGVKWSHWDDLANFYPQDEDGVARNTVDNVGVQYGLKALIDAVISKQAFLELNACVGGWKQPSEMSAENYPWNPAADPSTSDPWHRENMNLSPECKTGRPAPRTGGDISAMHVAYASGHVFTGWLGIPIIDMRHYLEPVLDMHHTRESFSARQRLVAGQGHADNQLIWVVECSDMDLETLEADCAYNPTGMGLDLLDQWLANIEANPAAGTVGNKPASAVDSCFEGDGNLLYAGPDAWDGVLDVKPVGPCAAAFPIYSSPRMVAGGKIEGSVFKCALKPLMSAVADGTYGGVAFSDTEIARLQEIFPTGVCDYSQPDVGRPSDKWVREWLKGKAKEFWK